jgi:mannose-6-phosphate isomerase-like protein (cupin superfamily)
MPLRLSEEVDPHDINRRGGPFVLRDSNADTEPKAEAAANYETVGYVITGRSELHIEGQVVDLEPGDSWIVPTGSRHSYKILDAFTTLEATTPLRKWHGRGQSEPAG